MGSPPTESPSPPPILLTNDGGIVSPGWRHALAGAVACFREVGVVTPVIGNPPHGAHHRGQAGLGGARRHPSVGAAHPLPPVPGRADALEVEVPGHATLDTPWQLTRLTRQRYYEPAVIAGPDGLPRLSGYCRHVDAMYPSPSPWNPTATPRRSSSTASYLCAP